MNTKKKQKNSEFYKTYEELIVDCIECKKMKRKEQSRLLNKTEEILSICVGN